MKHIANAEIKKEMERHRLSYREVAKPLGVVPSTVCYRLRTEMSDERKAEFLAAIADALAAREKPEG